MQIMSWIDSLWTNVGVFWIWSRRVFRNTELTLRLCTLGFMELLFCSIIICWRTICGICGICSVYDLNLQKEEGFEFSCWIE